MYKLAVEEKAHARDGRCLAVHGSTVVTGGLTGSVSLWKRDHDHFTVTASWQVGAPVYALAFNPVNATIFMGSKNGDLLEYDLQGVRKNVYTGHTKTLNSIAVNQDIVCTGSWDASVIIRNASNGQILKQFQNKEHLAHAVTVCPIDHDSYLIGSQTGDLLILQLQHDHEGQIIAIESKAHEDIIRSIRRVHNSKQLYLTSSNEGDVKLWRVNNSKIYPIPLSGHQRAAWYPTDARSFVFSVEGIISFEALTLQIFAGTNSGLLALSTWQLQDESECYEPPRLLTAETIWEHLAGIWDIAWMIESGEIVSISEDGMLRIFSQTYALDEDELELKRAQNALVQKQQQERKSSGKIDPKVLMPVQERQKIKGKLVGEVKLFRADNDVIEVHSWTGLEWCKVGDHIGYVPVDDDDDDTVTTPAQVYEGDPFFPAGTYDYIFPVEIESNQSKTRLPYNIGQDMHQVAERFCARENLGKHNISDILEFLRTNTNQKETNQLPMNDPIKIESSKPSLAFEPILFVQTSNWDAAYAKIIELEKVNKTFSDGDKMILLQAFDILKAPRFENQDLKNAILQLFFAPDTPWNSWKPRDELFPFFDVMRKLACHPSTSDFLRKIGAGGPQIIDCLQTLRSTHLVGPLSLCTCRYLTNLCGTSCGRNWAVDHLHHVIKEIKEVLAETKLDGITANTATAMTAFVFNLTIGFSSRHCHSTHEIRGTSKSTNASVKADAHMLYDLHTCLLPHVKNPTYLIWAMSALDSSETDAHDDRMEMRLKAWPKISEFVASSGGSQGTTSDSITKKAIEVIQYRMSNF